MKILATKDMIQKFKGNLEIPEIRVWCHPHYVKKRGDDYYKVFDTFAEAVEFTNSHEEAEEVPLIAFRGYELNLWTIVPEQEGERKLDEDNRKQNQKS